MMIDMRMKAALLIGVLVVAAALAVYALLPYLFPEPLPPALPTPRRISGVPFAYEIEDKVFVDVEEAAGGNAKKQPMGNIEYDEGGYQLLFIPTGLYMGVPFATEYRDDKDTLRMHITDSLDPNNGVIESWMTFNIRNDDLHVNIFLDRDWREQVKGTTNIMWGEEWDNMQEFGWDSISPGVYMDEISFPAEDYFGKPYSGINLMVSNATLEFIIFPEAFAYVTGFAFT
jgi:hypothetical protein